jgi:hypothetical protein
MVPISTERLGVAIALLVIVLFLVGVAQPTVNDVPGFSDHTGPTEAQVTTLERVDAGCAEAVATRSSSSTSGGTYEKLTFVEAPTADADLSAWVERTSPRGTDLSTFRVHVDSHATGPANESCDMGILYRIEVETSGGSPEGFFADAHGTRILWLENGRVSGCSASLTSPLDAECQRFYDDSRPDLTWANATG